MAVGALWKYALINPFSAGLTVYADIGCVAKKTNQPGAKSPPALYRRKSDSGQNNRKPTLEVRFADLRK